MTLSFEPWLKNAFLEEKICRFYRMPHVPLGLWSRLITRMIVFSKSVVTEVLAPSNSTLMELPTSSVPEMHYWKTGIFVCWSQKDSIEFYQIQQQALTMDRHIQGTSFFLLSSCISDKDDKEEIQITVPATKNGCLLLGQVVDHLDALIDEWYPGLTSVDPLQGRHLLEKYAPCVYCEDSDQSPYQFLLEDLLKQTESRLDAPDLVLSDLDSGLQLDVSQFDLVESPENLLGDGGYGAVYKAKYKNQHVAVKMFNAIGDIHPHVMLRQEATVLRCLKHPSVVSLLAVGVRPRIIVLELALKGSLSKVLRTEEHKEDLSRIIQHRIASQINAKISDYGIARFSTLDGLVAQEGTPAYRAPEVIRGETYSFKADVFSYGITIYSLLTGGKHPFFEYEFNSEMDRAISESKEILNQLMSPESLCLRQWVPVSVETTVECMAFQTNQIKQFRSHGTQLTILQNLITVPYCLTDLPDLIIIEILKFIPLQELLQSVIRTCKIIRGIIQNSPILWRNFEFENPIKVSFESLQYALKHSRKFKVFNIGFSENTCATPELDYLLTKKLLCGPNLVWIILSKSQISTLAFLQELPNLELLCIDECSNINDADCLIIPKCRKLEQLYLSFNNILAETVINITKDLSLINLDVAGIKFDILDCVALLNSCYESLLFFHLSLKDTVNPDDFERNVERNLSTMNVDEVIHLISSLYAEEPEDVCTVSVEPVIQLSQEDDPTILVPAQICESNMGIFETGANECVMNECTLDDNDNTELLPPDINTVYAPSQDEIDNTAFLTAVTRTVDVPSKDESNNIVSVPVDSCTVDIQSQKESNYIVSVPENTSIVDEPSKDHSYIDTVKEGNACRSRKRQKDPESWKQNVKRKRRQSGKPYIDYKGNSVKARELKTKKDCQGKCRFKCSVSISESERKNIFENFWTLNDSQKFYFYRDTLERSEKERTRTRNKESRKKFSVKYFFNVKER
ncbi:LOW QUALITY PROTEIN: hypothetical protein KUTeg_021235 [Tegillarca granosa]|uniref:non-specific serine/threonine protein kinase n=1 Tax=Tegillarca granosa TaxID=220873 RepID=A0ABQ9EG68_TEGGR|nr:LOW QUALITY PROTEIN: hypothetical protein KUTeg_021235 [Tegillarca granosa]